MSAGKRWIERIKTALILLLAALALFLGWKTQLFDGLFKTGEVPADAPDAAAVTSYQAALLPVCAAAVIAPELIHGVQYADEEMGSLLQDLRPILGEILGTAARPAPVEEQVWQAALLEPGLFLDYGCPVSLNVLARWMGTTADFAENVRACRLLLVPGKDTGAVLYFRDPEGMTFRCETMALSTALEEGIAAYLPNGAEFAMQYSSLSACDPYALILPRLPAMPVVSASDSGQEAALEAAARLMQVKLSTANSYPERSGTAYLGENGILHREADGSIRYTAEQDSALGEAADEADQIELSRRYLSGIVSACGGAGELRYSGTQQTDDVTVVSFSYWVGGLRVELSSGSAAWAQFRDGRLRELFLIPRTYTLESGEIEPLPALQAAAAAGSRQPGSFPELVLPDPGGESSFQAVWTVRERGR